MLARGGGDEFVILMPGVRDVADAEAMSTRVRESIERPFLVAGTEVSISASVGVHLAAPAGDPDQALRAADQAMYEGKHAGGGRQSHPRVRLHTGRHRAAS